MFNALPTALPSANTGTRPGHQARGRDEPAADDSGFARLMQQQSQLRQAQQRQLAQRQATPQPQAPGTPSAGNQVADATAADEAQPASADEGGQRSGNAADLAPPQVAEMPSWLQPQRPLASAIDGQATPATDGTGDSGGTGEPATDPIATASQPGAVLAGAINIPTLQAPNPTPINPPPGEVAAGRQAAAKTGQAVAQGLTTSPPTATAATAATAAAWSASTTQRGASTDAAVSRRSPANDRDEPVPATTGERAASTQGRGGSALPLAEPAHAEPAPAPGRAPGQAGGFEDREQASPSAGRDATGPGSEALGTLAGMAASSATPFQLSGPADATTLPAPAAADVPGQAQIPVPLDSPLFAPALGTQISLFARDGVQSAQLQLHPAEMGPISVQILLDGQTARVDFQADLAATRQVIEASLPALASALQDAGLTLAGGGVFQQSPGRQDTGQGAPARPPRGGERSGNGITLTAAAAPQQAPQRRGLVDLVA